MSAFAPEAVSGTMVDGVGTAATIRLTIAHGHLAFARFPVLVGHYEGDTFAGAEAQLDRALGFRLTERRRLGLYPGPLGTATVVLDGAARPRGAVVVGLGKSAALASGQLRRTLRHGLLAFAAAEADRNRAAQPSESAVPLPLGLTVLAVGTGEGGLDTTSGVIALLQAVAEAQAILGVADMAVAGDIIARTRFSELEFVEVAQDRALTIWHAAARAINGQPELGQLFKLAQKIDTRAGRRRLGIPGRDPGWWLPITIQMSGCGRNRILNFLVSDGLARAETRAVPADLDLVEPLVARAVGDTDVTGAPTSAGRVLFELLLPAALKDRSAEERSRRLILDEASACFPWELLDDRRPWIANVGSSAQHPPAVRSGLVRQLMQAGPREQVRVSRGRKALLIGDPRGSPTEGFAKLPAAESEAKAVQAVLGQHGFATKALIGDGVTANHVCRNLFAEAWEIVHIAAHGVVNEALPGPDGVPRVVTGVVLGGGIVLGPSVLSKLPVSPGIVFVNCCHLGKIDPLAEDQARQAGASGRPELAASVAVELIRSGVRCVVAAGWAVDDAAAEAFATRFYEEMLTGADFGSATLAARRVAYESHPASNTWGAYQCYGDPDYRLGEFAPPAVAPGGATPRFAIVDEAIEAAQQVSEEVNIGLERDSGQSIASYLDSQRAQMDGITKQADQKGWLSDPDLRVALADAHAQLGNLPAAIGHYEAAVAAPNARVRVKAIEQLANLAVRQAFASVRRRPPEERDFAAAAAVIGRAQARLATLTEALGESGERLALRGGCAKRLAQLQALGAPPGNVDHQLDCMAAFYDRAAELLKAERADGQDFRYPQLMACSARLCSALRAGRTVKTQVAELLEELRACIAPDQDDFWQLIASADATMMLAIARRDPDPLDWPDIVQRYRSAWRHVGSPLKLMSVREQLEFYEDVLAQAPGMAGTDRVALLSRLGDLRRELEVASGQAPA